MMLSTLNGYPSFKWWLSHILPPRLAVLPGSSRLLRSSVIVHSSSQGVMFQGPECKQQLKVTYSGGPKQRIHRPHCTSCTTVHADRLSVLHSPLPGVEVLLDLVAPFLQQVFEPWDQLRVLVHPLFFFCVFRTGAQRGEISLRFQGDRFVKRTACGSR